MSHPQLLILLLLLLIAVTFCTLPTSSVKAKVEEAPKKPCKEFGILVERKCVSRAPATPRCVKYHTAQTRVCVNKKEKCIKYEESIPSTNSHNHETTSKNSDKQVTQVQHQQKKCAEYSTHCKRYKFIPKKTCLVHELSCKEHGEVQRTVLLGHKLVKCNRHVSIEKPVCELYEKICIHHAHGKHKKHHGSVATVLTSPSGNQELLSTTGSGAAASSLVHNSHCPCTHWAIHKGENKTPVCKVHAELIKTGKRKCTKKEPIRDCKEYKQVKNAHGKLVFEMRTVQKCEKYDTSKKVCVLKIKELKRITSSPRVAGEEASVLAHHNNTSDIKFEQVSRCLKYRVKKTCLVKKMVQQKICKEKSNKITGEKCVAWSYGQVTRSKICTLYSVPFTKTCVKRDCSNGGAKSVQSSCGHDSALKKVCARVSTKIVELKSKTQQAVCLEPQFEAISKTFTEPVCKKHSQICLQYSVKLKKKCTKKAKKCIKYHKKQQQEKGKKSGKHKKETKTKKVAIGTSAPVQIENKHHVTAPQKCKEKVEECVEYKTEKKKTCKEFESAEKASKRKGKCIQFKNVEKKICLDKKVKKSKKIAPPATASNPIVTSKPKEIVTTAPETVK